MLARNCPDDIGRLNYVGVATPSILPVYGEGGRREALVEGGSPLAQRKPSAPSVGASHRHLPATGEELKDTHRPHCNRAAHTL